MQIRESGSETARTVNAVLRFYELLELWMKPPEPRRKIFWTLSATFCGPSWRQDEHNRGDRHLVDSKVGGLNYQLIVFADSGLCVMLPNNFFFDNFCTV